MNKNTGILKKQRHFDSPEECLRNFEEKGIAGWTEETEYYVKNYRRMTKYFEI